MYLFFFSFQMLVRPWALLIGELYSTPGPTTGEKNALS